MPVDKKVREFYNFPKGWKWMKLGEYLNRTLMTLLCTDNHGLKNP